MRRAVLMPGHRRPEAGFLDERDLVVRHEIVAQESRRHAQQPGMAIEPERGIHQVQVAVEQFHGPRRAALARSRLQHGSRVTTVVLVGAAQRIAQRFGELVGRLQDALAQRRPPAAIQRCAGFDRGTRQHGVDIGAQFPKLLGSDHPFEHVEAVRPVGVHDLGREPAVGAEPDRPAVAERVGARLAGAAVIGHRPQMIGGGERRGGLDRGGFGRCHRKLSRMREATDDSPVAHP